MRSSLHIGGKSRRNVLHPMRWDPPLLWKLPTELAAKRPGDSAIIRAGGRLYGQTGQTLIAVDLPRPDGGAAKVAWQQPLDGTAAELLAADGKLFAVTREGRIACFGTARGKPRSTSSRRAAGAPPRRSPGPRKSSSRPAPPKAIASCWASTARAWPSNCSIDPISS